MLCGQLITSPSKEIPLPVVSVAKLETDTLGLSFWRPDASAPETLTLEQLANASFSDGKGENDPQFAKTFSTPALVIFLKDGSSLTLAEPPVDFASILGDDELFEA